jgi:replication factor C subunit 1
MDSWLAIRFRQHVSFSCEVSTFAQQTNVAGVEITNRSVLILDEVDGMSAGDRGGIGAMNQLIKKTKVIAYTLLNMALAQS